MKKILKSLFSEIYESSLQNIDDLFQQYHWYYTFNSRTILQISEKANTNDYVLYFPTLNLKVSTVGSKFNNVHNPFFNKNLQQYLKNTW